MMIGLKEFPFAISLLPFLAVGICLPVTVRDWFRGRLMEADGKSMAIGVVIIVVWYGAILHSVRSKREDGKVTLFGRSLESWLWAPLISFVVGLVGGAALL